MKIIYNNLIPFPGYTSMMLFGVIFARKSACPIDPVTIHHEEIHRAQARDCKLYLFYYLLYLYWWVRRGYGYNPLELEAYAHEIDADYLTTRKSRAWAAYAKVTKI
jgi:hypothetical protein